MAWIKLKDNLPKRDKDYVLFVKWKQLNSTETEYPPIILNHFVGFWEDVQYFRKYDLENSFTHWIKLGRAPKD